MSRTVAAEPKNRKPRRVYSRSKAVRTIDGRRWEAALMRQARAKLVAHCGTPSATQTAIIEQAVWLTLHLELMNRRMATEGVLGEGAGRRYLAWSNSLAKLLRQLGLKAAAAPKRTIAEYLAQTTPAGDAP